MRLCDISRRRVYLSLSERQTSSRARIAKGKKGTAKACENVVYNAKAPRSPRLKLKLFPHMPVKSVHIQNDLSLFPSMTEENNHSQHIGSFIRIFFRTSPRLTIIFPPLGHRSPISILE